MGRAVGEALAQALTQYYVADVMDAPLTYAELAVFEVHGPRPELLPFYGGAEIARFATQKLGIAPTSPFGLVCRLFQSASEFGGSVWRFLWWLNCPVAPP